MVTGFYISSIGLSTGETGVFSLRVYNSGTLVLTVNFQCTLPSTRKPLFIPFSYVSQAQNPTTTTPSATLDYISFSSGVQNPIYEPGSQFSCNLVQINSSDANIVYSSTSLNSSVIVSQAYGTTMLAYTKLAVTTPITPVQINSTTTSKTIQFTSTTTPANVGGTITYTSPISGSVGSVNSSTGALTIVSKGYLGRGTVNASQAATSIYNPATASASVDIIGYRSTLGNIGTNTGTVAQSMTNNPTLNGYFIDVNIPLATTITGISFQYSGNMNSNYNNGYSNTIMMKLAKSSNPEVVLASTTFTYLNAFGATYNTNDDGTLCIIPFVNGNAFNTDTYPITVMPTKILSVSGSVSTNGLTFAMGDTIRITLINASSPLTPNVLVYTATSSPTATTLACSVISTTSYDPFTGSLVTYSAGYPMTLGNSNNGGSGVYNFLKNSITSTIQLNFPNFNTAIIATGFTIPVKMNSYGTYDGQLVLAYSGGGSMLIIDFILASPSTISSVYIDLKFPFNMPIGSDIGTKLWAETQNYGFNGGYYITNVRLQGTNNLGNINNGLNISSNPRLGSASAAGGYYYILLGLSGSFQYQIAPGNTNTIGNAQSAVYSLHGVQLSTTN